MSASVPGGSGHPSIPSYTALQQHNSWLHALPMGYGHAQPYGAALQNPRNIRKAASAQPGVSRRTSERS
jgi:hypothetical protein